MRRLGGKVKGRILRTLVAKHEVESLCLQKVMEAITNTICQSIFDNFEIKWSFVLVINSTGGVISMWKKWVWEAKEEVRGQGSFGAKRRVLKEGM